MIDALFNRRARVFEFGERWRDNAIHAVTLTTLIHERVVSILDKPEFMHVRVYDRQVEGRQLSICLKNEIVSR